MNPGLFTARLDGPAPEVDVSKDLSKRGLIAAPVIIAVCGVIWGGDGAWSSTYGVILVIANFLLAAAIIATFSRISLASMLGGVLFGYLVRLGLIFLAVWLVKDTGWISPPALGATILVTHLGLLVWELRYVALSLAYPGLKPSNPSAEPSMTTSRPPR